MSDSCIRATVSFSWQSYLPQGSTTRAIRAASGLPKLINEETYRLAQYGRRTISSALHE